MGERRDSGVGFGMVGMDSAVVKTKMNLSVYPTRGYIESR